MYRLESSSVEDKTASSYTTGGRHQMQRAGSCPALTREQAGYAARSPTLVASILQSVIVGGLQSAQQGTSATSHPTQRHNW